MLTVPQLRSILETVTYRPGWLLGIRNDPHEGPYLRVITPTVNSYDGQSYLDLGIDTYLSVNDRENEETFLRFLIWRLERIESHEAREWLRRDGQPIFDPHARDSQSGQGFADTPVDRT